MHASCASEIVPDFNCNWVRFHRSAELCPVIWCEEGHKIKGK